MQWHRAVSLRQHGFLVLFTMRIFLVNANWRLRKQRIDMHELKHNMDHEKKLCSTSWNYCVFGIISQPRRLTAGGGVTYGWFGQWKYMTYYTIRFPDSRRVMFAKTYVHRLTVYASVLSQVLIT